MQLYGNIKVNHTQLKSISYVECSVKTDTVLHEIQFGVNELPDNIRQCMETQTGNDFNSFVHAEIQFCV